MGNLTGCFQITTNNKPRDLLGLHELTEKEKADFDYVDPEDEGGYRFFRYRGNVYDVFNFITIGKQAPIEMRRWDGYHSDSFFSGVVVRFVEDNEAVVVGHYYS